MTPPRLKRGDIVRVRRVGDSDWSLGTIDLAYGNEHSEKQSVAISLETLVRAKGSAVIAGLLPLFVEYDNQLVTGLDGCEYEIEIAPSEIPVKDLICDFCSAPNPTWEYPAGDFKYGPALAESTGPWTACNECAALIEQRNRKELLRRMVECFMEKWGDVVPDREHVCKDAEYIQALFFKSRIGKVTGATPLKVS